MRLFIAVELDHELRQRLVGLQEDLRTYRADVKWVEAENLHVTLQFLGETDAHLLPGVLECMAKSVAGLIPFHLSLAGTGAFPGLVQPRVIWAGLEGGAAVLRKLHCRLGACLRETGVAIDRKPFFPHVTLGRVRSLVNTEQLAAGLRRQAEICVGSQQVESYTLFESRLTSAGPRYLRLKAVKPAQDPCR